MYPGGKQFSLVIPEEDFGRLDAKVQKEKLSNPNYAYADLIRHYVHQGLAREAKRAGEEIEEEINPKASPKRQAFTIWRLAYRLAKELEE